MHIEWDLIDYWESNIPGTFMLAVRPHTSNMKALETEILTNHPLNLFTFVGKGYLSFAEYIYQRYSIVNHKVAWVDLAVELCGSDSRSLTATRGNMVS